MKSVFLMSMIVFCSLSLFGQAPEAFKYQAVVRDVEGQILENKSIDLRISILKDSEKGLSVFTEYHYARTNDFGLVSLEIGGGEAVSGEFENIDWGLTSYFVKIEIDADRDREYEVMGNSRLLSVPYALYAKTAERVLDDQSLSSEDRSSNCANTPYNWCDDCKCVNGIKTLEVLYLGPSNKDIFIYTNQKLTALVDSFPNAQDGDILSIDASGLKLGALDYYTYFAFMDTAMEVIRVNTSCQERIVGETFKYFTMIAQKDKLNNACDVCDLRDDWKLGGNAVLQYDSLCNRIGTSNRKDFVMISDNKSRFMLHKDGMVEVTNRNPTLLSGTLTVDKATDLNASLNVDGPTDLNSTLMVNNMSPTTLTGTQAVYKDASFGEHIFINSDPLDSAYISTSPQTGALVVKGGAGIGTNLFVGGKLDVKGPADFAQVNITGQAVSSSPTTGALIIEGVGGAGIGGNLHVGGSSEFSSGLRVTNAGVFDAVPGKTGTGHVAKFVNTADGSGIVIQVGQANPQNKNNFVTFKNAGGTTVGRIEGEHTAADFANNADYVREVAFLGTNIAFVTTDALIAGLESIQGGVKVVATATSSTACVGFGACFTAPIPSLIVESGSNLILKIANVVKYGAAIAIATADLASFIALAQSNKGVTFNSGHEDYAEYLEKQYYDEDYLPGEVVGMRNGFISRETYAVEKVMVISHNPIVLGGMPEEGQEKNFEKVAFLGQVPTRVMGIVDIGDYLLPSGLNNGFAIGKTKDEMSISDYKKVIGISWEKSTEHVGIVNTAIGLNTNDLADRIEKQETKIEVQQDEIYQLKSTIQKAFDVLSNTVPGFKDAIGWKDDQENAPQIDHKDDNNHPFVHDRTHLDDIVYHEVTDAEIDEMFKQAKAVAIEAGVDFRTDPFWSKIESDHLYLTEIKNTIREKLDKAVHTHKRVNQEMSGKASPKLSK
ncbi:MAG: hypothetical protein HKN92_06860 [Chitinophagales bacterium]|nr:hypothetical protein [Chitinophagales bacterium]